MAVVYLLIIIACDFMSGAYLAAAVMMGDVDKALIGILFALQAVNFVEDYNRAREGQS